MKLNEFAGSQEGMNSSENEFLSSQPLSKIFLPSGKDDTINKLEERNNKLRAEISKVQNALSSAPNKTSFGIKVPQITHQTMTKELENAYKQIKSYEYEIQKLEKNQNEGLYVTQLKKIQRNFKQKQQLSSKLRRQLNMIEHGSAQVTKLLKNNYQKGQNDSKILVISSQIKWLREKVKQKQLKITRIEQNNEKQQKFIKKLQIQLKNTEGFDADVIKNLRQKLLKRQTTQTQFHRTRKQEEQDFPFEEQVRTYSHYQCLLAEIKLFQKLEKDYRQKFVFYEKEKNFAITINLESRNRLIEVEDQIQSIQKRIEEVKLMIDPRNLRPTRAFSLSSTGKYGKKTPKITKSPFNHLFKNDQIGTLSKGGRKFTDLLKIGKNPSRIIGIDFYLQKEENQHVVGLQALYQTKQGLKKGNLNMICDRKKTEIVSFRLNEKDDYFIQAECSLAQNELITGILLSSKSGVTAKGGTFEGVRRPFNIGINERPGCFYGSFSQQGIELLGFEIIDDN